MHLYRATLSVLVAVAIVFAPMAAAWAGGARKMGMALPHTASHAVERQDSVAASAMNDCASMMKGAANGDDCPCCEKDKACPPLFCMAKCFQFFGIAQQSRPLARLVTALLGPSTLAHPPEWSDQPQPPPPRT